MDGFTAAESTIPAMKDTQLAPRPLHYAILHRPWAAHLAQSESIAIRTGLVWLQPVTDDTGGGSCRAGCCRHNFWGEYMHERNS